MLAIQERLGEGRLTGEDRPSQARQIYQALGDYGYSGSYKAVVGHLNRQPAGLGAGRLAMGKRCPIPVLRSLAGGIGPHIEPVVLRLHARGRLHPPERPYLRRLQGVGGTLRVAWRRVGRGKGA